MPESWYMCKMCGLLTCNNNIPNSYHCSVNNTHTWIKLIEFGSTNYICKRCGTIVQGVPNKSPNASYCRNGTHFTTHMWFPLGTVGIPPHILNYKCLNCGSLVSSLKPPLGHGCPASSTHKWIKI